MSDLKKIKIGNREVIYSVTTLSEMTESVELYPFDFSDDLRVLLSIDIDDEVDESKTIITKRSDELLEINWKGPWKQGNLGTSSAWRKFGTNGNIEYLFKRAMNFIGSPARFTVVSHFVIVQQEIKAG